MTLHETTELVKKAGIGSFIGTTIILVIVILVRVAINVNNSINPPKKDPPTQLFGVLPNIQFPENAVNNNFTYTLDTMTGDLPTDLPDRLSVFPIVNNNINFINFMAAQDKVRAAGFVSQDRKVLPEIRLENPYYEWDEQTGFRRKIIFNINSFDFKITSNYLSSPVLLSGRFAGDEGIAKNTVNNFLSAMGLMPPDTGMTKTKLYSIQNEKQGKKLVEETELAKMQVVRVNFYQNDVKYDLYTGDKLAKNPTVSMKLPILYPHPPFSIMSLWVATSETGNVVAEAYFTHKNIDFTKSDATYGIKTVREAFSELKQGKAYIAGYDGTDDKIAITNVYLAYYVGENREDYLMPIYVFEGKDGFFSYVSAI